MWLDLILCIGGTVIGMIAVLLRPLGKPGRAR